MISRVEYNFLLAFCFSFSLSFINITIGGLGFLDDFFWELFVFDSLFSSSVFFFLVIGEGHAGFDVSKHFLDHKEFVHVSVSEFVFLVSELVGVAHALKQNEGLVGAAFGHSLKNHLHHDVGVEVCSAEFSFVVGVHDANRVKGLN